MSAKFWLPVPLFLSFFIALWGEEAMPEPEENPRPRIALFLHAPPGKEEAASYRDAIASSLMTGTGAFSGVFMIDEGDPSGMVLRPFSPGEKQPPRKTVEDALGEMNADLLIYCYVDPPGKAHLLIRGPGFKIPLPLVRDIELSFRKQGLEMDIREGEVDADRIDAPALNTLVRGAEVLDIPLMVLFIDSSGDRVFRSPENLEAPTAAKALEAYGREALIPPGDLGYQLFNNSMER